MTTPLKRMWAAFGLVLACNITAVSITRDNENVPLAIGLMAFGIITWIVALVFVIRDNVKR